MKHMIPLFIISAFFIGCDSTDNSNKGQIKELVKKVNDLGSSIIARDYTSSKWQKTSLGFKQLVKKNCQYSVSLDLGDAPVYNVDLFQKETCNISYDHYYDRESTPYKTETESTYERNKCSFGLMDIDFDHRFSNEGRGYECAGDIKCAVDQNGATESCYWTYNTIDEYQKRNIRHQLEELQALQ